MQTQIGKKPRRVREVFSVIFLLAVILGLLNYRTILDFVAYYSTPMGSVSQTYSDQLQLTDGAKLVFYGTYPEINSKSQFNANCKPGENIQEFGCYYNNLNKIYLLEIKEPNLKTMMGTGAAHEFLHAVYARFSQNEIRRLGELLEAGYRQVKNPDLDERLASYARTEPESRTNELHSILGSEYPNLSQELEVHYRQYFKKRAEVVSWQTENEKYIKEKESTLKAKKSEIENKQKELDQLNAQMNSLKKTGKIGQYNALVPTQNNLVYNLREMVNRYNQLVATYNDIIASLNSHTYSSYDATLIK